MKHVKNLACFALLLLTLAAGAQKKKVAVVTFYVNKMIDFTDLGLGSEELLKDLLNLRDDPRFNLKPILDKYHDSFFNDYAKAFPFDLLPESAVVDSDKYKAFEPKYDLSAYDARNYLVEDRYKYIYEGFAGKANEEGMARLFADQADGVMFVSINFALVKGFGIGGTASLKVRVNTRIALYNKTGEKVFAITEGEQSKKTAVMVGGLPVLKPEKILPMCESALEELMGDLRKRLDKIASKSDKKL